MLRCPGVRVVLIATGVLSCVALWISVPPAIGQDRVTVEPKTVSLGATGVDIAIFIENGLSLQALDVPLVIREITPGSYITALSMSYADRLPESPGAPLSDIVIKHQFPTPNGSCGPDGFGLPAGVVDFVSPDAVNFARAKITSPPLTAGLDATGSLHLTVDVTTSSGEFEIDTTCVDPSNHLLFAIDPSGMVAPAFEKGIITITGSCDDFDGVIADADSSQHYGLYLIKFTHFGLEFKPVHTTVAVGDDTALDMDLFTSLQRPDADYGNDSLVVIDFPVSAAEVESFIGALAMDPTLITSQPDPDPVISMTILAYPSGCFEHLYSIENTKQVIDLFRQSLSSGNTEGIDDLIYLKGAVTGRY